MEEIMYEFGGYSDDHDFEWPAAEEFSDGSDGNIMSSEVISVVVDTCSNLQEEDQKKNIISSHLLYPKLLLTYIDCHKVGAPPEIVNMLDKIAQENDLHRRSSSSSTALNQPITDDSELDDFMATYCDVLAKLKLDLGRSFNEATTFLNDIQTQLTNLSTTTNISARVEDIGTGEKGWSDDNNPSLSFEFESAIEQIKKEEGAEAEVEEEGDTMGGGGGVNNEQQNDELCRSGSEIKDKLMEKYSGYITSLKHDFCKKNYNKGKLPKEATQILLNWWTTHYNWPYPTEGEKLRLAESTGLDPKQINNWFINQRKRHWKLPSQNMQFPVMETIYGRHFSQ